MDEIFKSSGAINTLGTDIPDRLRDLRKKAKKNGTRLAHSDIAQWCEGELQFGFPTPTPFTLLYADCVSLIQDFTAFAGWSGNKLGK